MNSTVSGIIERIGYYCQVWEGETAEISIPYEYGAGSYRDALYWFNKRKNQPNVQLVELYKGKEVGELHDSNDDPDDPENWYWHIKDGCDWDVIKTWSKPHD